MVERLKEAIEKARQQRTTGARPLVPSGQDREDAAVSAAWRQIEKIEVDPRILERHGVISASRNSGASLAFDILRTRLMKVCRDNRWTSIVLTSPTKGCGKSFVCMNLAFSLARNAEFRTVLLDLDLRNPSVAEILGTRREPGLTAYLKGEAAMEHAFVRHGENLAFGLSAVGVRNTSELFQTAQFSAMLSQIKQTLAPDIVIIDMPPMFVSDDVLAFLEHADALALVAGAGVTKAHEIRECERLIGESVNFLGIVLNKVEETDLESYDSAY